MRSSIHKDKCKEGKKKDCLESHIRQRQKQNIKTQTVKIKEMRCFGDNTSTVYFPQPPPAPNHPSHSLLRSKASGLPGFCLVADVTVISPFPEETPRDRTK